MSQTFTIDDLAAAIKALTKRGQLNLAAIVQWGYGQIQILTTWQTVAQGQLEDLANQVVSDDATISTLQGQVADAASHVAELQAQITELTAQLAAATISPVSLVMINTHLYGFSSVPASQTFCAANSEQSPQQFPVADYKWMGDGSE